MTASEKAADARLRRVYKKTLADKLKEIAAQGGGCAICGRPYPEYTSIKTTLTRAAILRAARRTERSSYAADDVIEVGFAIYAIVGRLVLSNTWRRLGSTLRRRSLTSRSGKQY